MKVTDVSLTRSRRRKPVSSTSLTAGAKLLVATITPIGRKVTGPR